MEIKMEKTTKSFFLFPSNVLYVFEETSVRFLYFCCHGPMYSITQLMIVSPIHIKDKLAKKRVVSPRLHRNSPFRK